MDAEGSKDVPEEEDSQRPTIPEAMPFLVVVERLYELIGVEADVTR